VQFTTPGKGGLSARADSPGEGDAQAYAETPYAETPSVPAAAGEDLVTVELAEAGLRDAAKLLEASQEAARLAEAALKQRSRVLPGPIQHLLQHLHDHQSVGQAAELRNLMRDARPITGEMFATFAARLETLSGKAADAGMTWSPHVALARLTNQDQGTPILRQDAVPQLLARLSEDELLGRNGIPNPGVTAQQLFRSFGELATSVEAFDPNWGKLPGAPAQGPKRGQAAAAQASASQQAHAAAVGPYDQPPPRRPFNGNCFNCGKAGHPARECRAPKTGAPKTISSGYGRGGRGEQGDRELPGGGGRGGGAGGYGAGRWAARGPAAAPAAQAAQLDDASSLPQLGWREPSPAQAMQLQAAAAPPAPARPSVPRSGAQADMFALTVMQSAGALTSVQLDSPVLCGSGPAFPTAVVSAVTKGSLEDKLDLGLTTVLVNILRAVAGNLSAVSLALGAGMGTPENLPEPGEAELYAARGQRGVAAQRAAATSRFVGKSVLKIFGDQPFLGEIVAADERNVSIEYQDRDTETVSHAEAEQLVLAGAGHQRPLRRGGQTVPLPHLQQPPQPQTEAELALRVQQAQDTRDAAAVSAAVEACFAKMRKVSQENEAALVTAAATGEVMRAVTMELAQLLQRPQPAEADGAADAAANTAVSIGQSFMVGDLPNGDPFVTLTAADGKEYKLPPGTTCCLDSGATITACGEDLVLEEVGTGQRVPVGDALGKAGLTGLRVAGATAKAVANHKTLPSLLAFGDRTLLGKEIVLLPACSSTMFLLGTDAGKQLGVVCGFSNDQRIASYEDEQRCRLDVPLLHLSPEQQESQATVNSLVVPLMAELDQLSVSELEVGEEQEEAIVAQLRHVSK
jgi:hypothetical protein